MCPWVGHLSSLGQSLVFSDSGISVHDGFYWMEEMNYLTVVEELIWILCQFLNSGKAMWRPSNSIQIDFLAFSWIVQTPVHRPLLTVRVQMPTDSAASVLGKWGHGEVLAPCTHQTGGLARNQVSLTLGPWFQSHLRRVPLLAENKAHWLGMCLHGLWEHSHQPKSRAPGDIRDQSPDHGGRQVARVQDEPDHAEVRAGRAILQKPRACSSFLFDFFFLLFLSAPFLGSLALHLQCSTGEVC